VIKGRECVVEYYKTFGSKGNGFKIIRVGQECARAVSFIEEFRIWLQLTVEAVLDV
jgi:hypothetical protein